MKTILLAGAVMLGLLQSARAFSLAGPVGNGGDDWQTGELGYGGINAPKNLGEEYRRNTPVMYYAFDAQFYGYFGTDGMAAVDKAFAVMNSLTNVSSYSANLSEFPIESRHVNYRAQALGLYDVKSVTLGALVEQMGLADPIGATWGLHDRYHVGSVPCPVGMEYLVVQRNFDIVSSPLNKMQYSPYVNGILYSYQIIEGCIPPVAVAVPYSADPLADAYSPVASTMIGLGDFYKNGLTRDDVAGLRYLLRTNNVNWESAPADSTLFTITTNSSQQLFPNGSGTNASGTNASAFYYYDGTYGYGDLRGLLTAATTNDPTTLQAMYPGLVISSYSNNFVLATNLIVTSYYTSGGAGSPSWSLKLVTVTNKQTYMQERFYYQFANIFTNHYYSKSVSYLQTVTVAPPASSPYGSPPSTNITKKTLTSTNIPSGDFFILPLFQTNVCPLDILYVGLTNVIATTNLITSASTNVVTATNTTSYSSYQQVVTYFTNYTFVINPVTCSQTNGATGAYMGIENIKFVNAQSAMPAYDSSMLEQFMSPITNNYTMVHVTTSGQAELQHFQRIVTQPDFLFSAQDMVAGPDGPPVVVTYSRNLNFDTANMLPGLAGPGTITTPTTFTFEKAGPVYYNDYGSDSGSTGENMIGTPYFTQLPGDATTNLFYTGYFVWASFDGTTNDPVVWPNGTSIDSLENQILIRVSPAIIPAGQMGYAYTTVNPLTTFTATGGSLLPPYTWSATGLPDGWSVTPDGMLVGTPTAAGTTIFTLTLTDSLSRSVQWKYSLTIQP